ncbi:ABC transporter ATP-binding protein [Zavarzinia compransoris]|uniref:ABC transporter ATP-binding protein n=1 Tax=Zavarzinia compransoris TaxID=1264899 RepID=A0A317E3U1_9PROT|nr:ABC transporter ATP-binding protein [Zavarzinia compransoris]PWR21649.1 ABC transporter ATP-binding protein [Zavarzinia compransoris]TDP45570.1 amino acid/amide ABC transporter ATP-binding protein 1 (HAAT family) [Zavarzinia compransoris]
MTVLSLQKVSKSFGGVHAAAGIDLEVGAGEIVGLIGPNGAGKTTIVNLVTGMLKLTAGRILLNGTDVSEASARDIARAGVARTFQNIRLLREETVTDNIIVGFHRHETSSLMANLIGLPSARAERRRFQEAAERLLEQFEMTEYARMPAGALAYGHQRRVEMMRAMATSPSLLMLDEPVAGMNDVEAEELARIFAALAEGGMSVLLIEHNIPFVMSLCRKLYVVNSGRPVASGTPAEVSADPAVIAAYLGS